MKLLKKVSTFKKPIIGIVISFLMILLVGLQVALPQKVDGHSMDTTLKNNQHMLLNKWSYTFSTPHYGDIVIVESSSAEGQIVKRIAGLPGDELEFKGHVLYRNGVKVSEDYVKGTAMNEIPEGKIKIGSGEVYILGDNRKVSFDSRQMGPINASEIVGKVIAY